MIRSMREGSVGGDDGKLKASSRSRSRSRSLTPAPYEEPWLPSGVRGRMSRSVSPAVIVEEAGRTKREDREYDEEEEAARNHEAERRRRKRTRELSIPLEEIEEGLRRDEEREKAKRGRKEGSSRSAAGSNLPQDRSFGVGEEEQKMMDEVDDGATDLARGQEDFEMALREEEEEGMPQEEDFAFQNDVFGFGCVLCVVFVLFVLGSLAQLFLPAWFWQIGREAPQMYDLPSFLLPIQSLRSQLI
jgi:hypothetical protein